MNGHAGYRCCYLAFCSTLLFSLCLINALPLVHTSRSEVSDTFSPTGSHSETDASQYSSCLYDEDAAQWYGLHGEVISADIGSWVDCVAWCKRWSQNEAGFYDDGSLQCICATVESTCSECEAIGCQGDDVTCAPAIQNGDDVCGREYVSNAFYTAWAFDIGGFEFPFSSNTSSSITVSDDPATPYEYVYDFGDGSEAYIGDNGNEVSHYFFMPGNHEVTLATSAYEGMLTLPVRVQDPPTSSQVYAIDSLGSDASDRTITLLEGTDVQVKWSRSNEGGGTVDATPCAFGGTYSAESESCYVAETDEATYDEALATCLSNYGGWPVMPKSTEENERVVDEVMDDNMSEVWLGLSDSIYEGTWFWSDVTQLLDTQAQWTLDSNDGSTNCATLQRDSEDSDNDSESSAEGSSSSDWSWNLESCDEERSVICQYPAWEVHTVPKYFAGVPISMSGSDAVTELTETDSDEMSTTTGTTLYLFPGSWFSRAGTLRTWLFESISLTSDSELRLQVYRPSCESGRFLKTPGCDDAPYAICTTSNPSCPGDADDTCTSGHTYCPLTRTCLAPRDMPCTCANANSSCDVDAFSFQADMYPVMTQVDSFNAVVTAEDSGTVQRFHVWRDVEVEANDIIGVQIDSSMDLPIRCEDLSSDDTSPWQQQSYVSMEVADWLQPGDVIDSLSTSATMHSNMNCYIASTYTEPVTLSIPDTLISNIDDSTLYSFSFELFNAVGSIVSRPTSAPTLHLLTPCSEENEENETCLLPTHENIPFLFRVESASEYVSLTLNYSDHVANFSYGCPSFFENRTFCEVEHANYQYAPVNVSFTTSPETMVLSATACDVDLVCSYMSFTAILQRRPRISSITSDPEHIYFGEPVELNLSFAGDPYEVVWNVSNTLYENVTSVTHTFDTPNRYDITVTMWNLLGQFRYEDHKYALDIFNGTNITTAFQPIVALGHAEAFTAHAYFAPFTRGELVFQFSDTGDALSTEANNYHDYFEFVHGHVTYAFQVLGEQTINVTLADPLQGDFFDFTVGSVDVWHPIDEVRVSSSPEMIVETGTTVSFELTQINGTRNFTYDVDFQDGSDGYQHAETTDSSISFEHSFTAPGSFNVTATVANRVTSGIGYHGLHVQDRIRGLELHHSGFDYIGNSTTVVATITNGTDVIYEIFVGDNATEWLSQDSGTLVFTFGLVGNYTIRVLARNGINHMEQEIVVEIRDLSPFIFNGITYNPCVPRNNARFTADVSYHNYAWLRFTWRFGDYLNNVTTYSNESLTEVTHSFDGVGTYWVVLEIESTTGGAVSHVETNSTICVQGRVGTVELESYDEHMGFEAGSSVTQEFEVTVGRGTDYNITWSYFGANYTTNAPTHEIEFDTAGVYEISVRVYNLVNSRSNAITVNAYEMASGISAFHDVTDFTNNGSLPTAQAYQLDFSLAEGSNVTWTVVKTDLSTSDAGEGVYGAGQTYSYVDTEGESTPTNIRFDVTVNNPVSITSTSFTVFFQDEITDLQLTSNATDGEVPLSESLSLSTSIATGSHVHYTWSIVDPTGSEQVLFLGTDFSDIIVDFNMVDTHRVTVTAENDVSSVSQTIDVYVWQSHSVSIMASASTSPYLTVDEVIEFTVEYDDFMTPNYEWSIRGDTLDAGQINDESIQHAFGSEGTYQVRVELRELGYFGEDALTVYAQNPVDGLTLNLEETTDTYLQDATVYFVTSITQGTDVTYTWRVSNTNDASSIDDDAEFTQVSDNRASYVFTTAGQFRVTVTASNGVSDEEAHVTVEILEAVTGLEIHGCCGTEQTGDEVIFRATIDTGSNVAYNWTIDGVPATGQSQTFTPEHPGNYVISVTAANELSRMTVTDDLLVLDPLIDSDFAVSITSNPGRRDLYYHETSGLNVTFTANVTGGSHVGHLMYTWCINGSDQHVNDETMVAFFEAGWYHVRVEVNNTIGVVRSSYVFEVKELLCDPPLHDLIGDSGRSYLRSDSFKIEVSVQGCIVYEMIHEWTLYENDCVSGNERDFPNGMTRNTPTLTFEKRSMDYGRFCLKLTSRFFSIPASTSTEVILEIYASALKALIDGGMRRTLANTNPILLDGSPSYDPDSNINSLSYNWFCSSSAPRLSDVSDNLMIGPPTTDDYCDWIESQTNVSFIVEANRLLSDYEYNFTLVVSAPYRISGVYSQRVVVREASVPIVSINCVSCIESNIFTVSRRQHIKLIGSCDLCPLADYTWEVRDRNGDLIQLDRTNTNTGINSPNLSIQRNVLEDNNEYTFSLYVSAITDGSSVRSTGMASLILESSTPPSNGTCSVILPNQTIVALEDTFTVNCENWQDNSWRESALTYHIYVQSGDSTENWYPIYRGTSSTVTSFLSTQDGESVVDLFVEVIDESDASTQALHQQIAVVDAQPPSNMTRTEYISYTTMTTLSLLQDQNDPKILLQYMIAANLQLNAESSRSGSEEDEQTRETLRRNMLYILNSTRTISAIDDIQQVAYVLRLLTTHLDEFPVSLDMFEISLELMQTIVQSLIDEVSPAMTGEEFVPNYMVTSVSNLMEIMWSNVIANGFHNVSVTNIQKMAVNVTNGVTMLALGTQLVEEQPVTYDTGYIHISGQRVFGKDIQTTFDDGANQVGFVEDLMEDFRNSELFQVAMSFRYNPYAWGFINSGGIVTSRNVITYFSHPNGVEIPVNQLEDGDRVRMLLGQADDYDASDGSRRRRSTDDNLAEATYVELEKDQVPLTSKIDISANDIPDASSLTVNISIVTSADTDPTDAPLATDVIAYMSRDAIPHKDNYEEMLELRYEGTSGRFFIIDDFYSSSSAQKYYLTLENAGSDDVNVSVAIFSTTCQFYEPTLDTWSNEGCEPHINSTTMESYCLCNHMTMFASSVLVSPAELDFQDFLTSDPEDNPLAIILVCVLTAIYMGVALVAYRWDSVDATRTATVPLCGLDGEHKYEITVVTGKRKGAGTSAHVGINLYGRHGKSGYRHLQKLGAFQRSSVDTFLVATETHLGDLTTLDIWHDNTGLDPNWYLSRVMVRDMQENKTWYFLVKGWLTVEEKGGSLQKRIRPADEHEKSDFRTMLSEETTKGFSERHLWISLFERPARSRFTRFQRATVCLAVLFVYMFINAMWYGLLHEKPDPSEVDKQEYVQWVDVLIGLLAALITFPIAVGLIQLFKRIKPAEQIVPQNFDATEMVEMDVASRVGSAGSDSTRYYRQVPPRLDRLGSDMSGGSDALQCQPGGLRRTMNVFGVAPVVNASAKAPPGSSGGSTMKTRSSLSSQGKMYDDETILKGWDCPPSNRGGSGHSSSETNKGVHFHPETRHRSGSTHRGRSRTMSLDSYDELIYELDEIEDLYAEGPQSRQRYSFNPRQPPSVLDVSMGSLGNISDAPSAPRDRKISQWSHDTALEDVQENETTDEDLVPIQQLEDSPPPTGSYALQPGYIPRSTTGLSPGEPPVQRLPLPPPGQQGSKLSWELPHRCIYIAYALCFILYAVSAVCILLYGHAFGKDIALKWLTACCMSFFNSFFVLEPLKVIIVALIIAKITDNIEGCEERLSVAPVLESNETLKDIKMRPLAGFALLHAKEEAQKVVRMREMMRNFIAFMLFLLLVMIVNYASYHSLAIHMHRHVNSTYTVEMYNNDSHFRDILTYENYWDWLEQVAAPGVHARELQLEAEYGYVLGKAVLRQKRSSELNKCQATKQLNRFHAQSLYAIGCYGNPGWKEQTTNYGVGWDTTNDNQSWAYRDKSSEPYEGYMDTYDSGGYIISLGNSFTETIDIISSLRNNNWIDRATRAVLLEFSIYSVNTDLFAVVTFTVEFPVSSSALPSYDIQPVELTNFTTERITPYFVSEILLTLILIYLSIVLVLKLKAQKCSYFKSFGNWVMLLITSLTLASVLSYVAVLVVCTRAYDDYLHRRSGFTSMTSAAFWIREWKNINAVLLFVLMLLVVYQMRFIKFFARFIKTLQVAKFELLGMGFFFIAFLCYYAQLAYLWFGTVTYAMHSMGTSFTHTLSIFRGVTPFLDAMMTYDHAFTACFYVSLVFFLFVYVLGTIMAILNSAYKRVRMELYYHSTVETQDYEMVDFMLKRLKKWLKITEQKPAFRKVHFEGVPSVSSRQSTAKSLRSLGPPGSITSVTSSDMSSLPGELDAQVYSRGLVERADETWQRMMNKLKEVEKLDKDESTLEGKLESHYRNQKKEKAKRDMEVERKRQLRAKRLSKQRVDTKPHDEIMSKLSRDSDAQRAHSLWFSNPQSPFKSKPKYQTQSSHDSDIIISKPPPAGPHVFSQPRSQPDSPTYEPSFAAVGKGIGLSQFQKLGKDSPGPSTPGGTFSPRPKQPTFSKPRVAEFPLTSRDNTSDVTMATTRQSSAVNASTASASGVVLWEDNKPQHRRQSSADAPWLPPGRGGKLYSTSTDALTPGGSLSGSLTERRRRRSRSIEKSKMAAVVPPQKKAWDH